MLLAWFHLLGNYHDFAGTRNMTLSSLYVKEMLARSELSPEAAAGSSLNSLILFLAQQQALGLDYFDMGLYGKLLRISKKLAKEVLFDRTSQTNKALVINSYYMCLRIKKLAKEHSIDVARLWHALGNSTDKLLGIPMLSQCNTCSPELLEIGQEESLNSVEHLQQVAETFVDLFRGPETID